MAENGYTTVMTHEVVSMGETARTPGASYALRITSRRYTLMSLKKDNRGVIRLHDTTTHGGKVISVAHIPTDDGRPVACIGDMVICPQCKGTYPIVEGDSECTIEGVPMAFEGHKTACGAS